MALPETQQLEAFVAVAEQVPLNLIPIGSARRIHKLETQLEVKLLVRTSNGIWLSEAGTVFLDYAKKILDMLQKSVAAAQRQGGSGG